MRNNAGPRNMTPIIKGLPGEANFICVQPSCMIEKSQVLRGGGCSYLSLGTSKGPKVSCSVRVLVESHLTLPKPAECLTSCRPEPKQSNNHFNVT